MDAPGQAVVEYREVREQVRWMPGVRLRDIERKGRLRAGAGRIGIEDVVRLAAVRDELAAGDSEPVSSTAFGDGAFAAGALVPRLCVIRVSMIV